MSQETGKFLYFKVGLLKDSGALDALWQDALKHHMVDHPDKLIALRLTEYYEIISQGLVHPIAQVAQATYTPAEVPPEEPEQIASTSTPVSSTTNIPLSNGTATHVNTITANPPASVSSPSVNTITQRSMAQKAESEYMLANEAAYPAAAGAEKNAEEAADYWALL